MVAGFCLALILLKLEMRRGCWAVQDASCECSEKPGWGIVTLKSIWGIWKLAGLWQINSEKALTQNLKLR